MASPQLFSARFPPSLGGGILVVQSLSVQHVMESARAGDAIFKEEGPTAGGVGTAERVAEDVLLMRSIYSIRGEVIAPGRQEAAFRAMNAKERHLLKVLFRKMNNPDEEETAYFLASIAAGETPAAMAAPETDEEDSSQSQ